MHWCLLLIITMYFFMNLCTIFGPKSFFSKALIIRLFLVYLFICLNKNSTTQLFILIRFKSNNNLLRKYQSRFLEPTYWLRALVTLLTTCKPRQTKILLHSVFRQKQISSQIVPTTTMTYKTEKPQTICNRPHSTILKLHFTSKTCIQSEGPFMYYVSKFSDFFDPPPLSPAWWKHKCKTENKQNLPLSDHPTHPYKWLRNTWMDPHHISRASSISSCSLLKYLKYKFSKIEMMQHNKLCVRPCQGAIHKWQKNHPKRTKKASKVSHLLTKWQFVQCYFFHFDTKGLGFYRSYLINITLI